MGIYSNMLLHIYSLRHPVLRKDATSVNLKTAMGELTILENHRALMTLVQQGPIRITDAAGTEETVDAQSGFLEVRPSPETRGEVNILLD